MESFYGAKVTAKEITAYVPRPLGPEDPPEILHIQGASIPATCKLPANTRVSLMLKQQGADDDDRICIATLTCGHHDSMLISLTLGHYAEFSLVGHAKAEVHLHGSFAPAEAGDAGDEDEGEEEDEENMNPVQMMQKQLQSLVGKSSGLGEVDDEDEDDDSDEDPDASSEDLEGVDDGERIQTRHSGGKRVKLEEVRRATCSVWLAPMPAHTDGIALTPPFARQAALLPVQKIFIGSVLQLSHTCMLDALPHTAQSCLCVGMHCEVRTRPCHAHPT